MVDCSKRDEIYSAAKKVKFYLELEIRQGVGAGTWKCGGDGHIDFLDKVVEKLWSEFPKTVCLASARPATVLCDIRVLYSLLGNLLEIHSLGEGEVAEDIRWMA